jgi:Insulinase (Peptidase family M16)
MGYRTRRKNRTEEGDGVMKGSAEFSAGSEADGRAMRRRYAFYTAAGLLLFAAMIAMLSKKKSAGGKAVTGGLKVSSHFKVESHSVIPYGNASVQLLRHEKSGLAIMTMVSSDVTQDATFGMSFRTVPDNNHGTAHVVANAIFDGSVNYPVRDVWDAVARGSLQTYTDTWTDNDRSVFVFSTRNKVDFSNSIKVMMDAVVNPKMVDDESKWMFRQEGWRVELLHNKDLVLNGYVWRLCESSRERLLERCIGDPCIYSF